MELTHSISSSWGARSGDVEISNGFQTITVGDPHVAMMAPQDDETELTFLLNKIVFCLW